MSYAYYYANRIRAAHLQANAHMCGAGAGCQSSCAVPRTLTVVGVVDAGLGTGAVTGWFIK